MSEPTLQAQVDAARAYESLFVPALFGQWARTVTEAAQVQRGQRVLDVACGTGVLAREARTRTGPAGYVAGLDPSPGMLAVARELAPEIDWRQGTAESIPFRDGSFDVVASQFGLMFFADRLQALREMLRVLRARGFLVVAVWDGLDNIPAYAAEVSLLERLAGPDAANALRAPFALGDRQALRAIFEAADAASLQITTRRGTARFPSIRVMVEADLRGWLPAMGVHLDEARIGRILLEAENALGAYVASDGVVSFDAPVHIVVARGPERPS